MSFASVVTATRAPFLQAIMDLETPVMADGRIALIGDAAFSVRPHTAMGTSKAADDAVTLTEALASSSPIATALQDWQGERLAFGHAIARHGQNLGAQLE